MGFRRAKSTQGNTNCQKNIFEDDQVPGHHPRALRAALNDATVLSAWMSGGKSFHRMMDLGRKAFKARDDLTVGTGKF